VSDAAAEPLVLSDREQWRRDYRHRQRQKSTAAAILSTLIVAAATWAIVVHLPGWQAAKETFFSPSVFRSSFPAIARAFVLNIKIMVVAEIMILTFSLLIAVARTTTSPLLTPIRAATIAYVDLFRGFPMIILLYLFGLGIPSLRVSWLPKSATIWGTVAIIVGYSAFVSEVVRAGIQSVHPSQRAAARSLGLTERQTLRIVVLPQALRAVLPALLNDFVALQKDVGLIAIVGGSVDAVQQATIDVSLTYNFTPYLVAAFLFILLAIPTGRLADAYTARAKRRQQASSAI
jgi:polar amino acid transport system permease protein